MPVNIPLSSMFWKPDQNAEQRSAWNQANKQLEGWGGLPASMRWDWGKHGQPYFSMAQGGLNDAWGASLSGLQGSQAFQNLMAGSGLNADSMRFAMGQQRQGGKLMDEELARIAALDKGGWDVNNAAAFAEIAPEVNAAGAQFDESLRGLEASGVRGGALASMKYSASRDRGTAVGNALQEAIRRNRDAKMGIANAKFGAQNLTMQDPSGQAAAQLLGQLYGGRADAFTNLYGNLFETGTRGEMSNLDRGSDMFKFLQDQAWGKARSDMDRWFQTYKAEGEELGRNMRSFFGGGGGMPGGGGGGGGDSDSRIKTPPDKVRGALSEIKKLPVYDYQYNDKAETVGIPSGTPGRGVMAQDLEKIPTMKHLVYKDPDTGYRKVDVYGLTATALRAVQELDKKLDRLAKARAPKGISRIRMNRAFAV